MVIVYIIIKTLVVDILISIKKSNHNQRSLLFFSLRNSCIEHFRLFFIFVIEYFGSTIAHLEFVMYNFIGCILLLILYKYFSFSISIKLTVGKLLFIRYSSETT